MKEIELIKNRIFSVKKTTKVLIENINLQNWNKTPAIIETNMNWQIGHIILSTYLHGIASITGANETVTKKIDMRDFVRFYGPNSIPKMFFDEKPKNEELVELYDVISDLVYLELSKINSNELYKTTRILNPNASTKYEALTYLSNHQSWHNGQIAILKRILCET